MIPELTEIYERDRRVWESCADVYEQQIVSGHPDVTAYEQFEEDLLDRLLIYLIRDRQIPVQLFDVCCGSARLHLRYGLKTAATEDIGVDDREKVAHIRTVFPQFRFEPSLFPGLKKIGGIDFSVRMTELAREKLARAGLGSWIGNRLSFQNGSAFDLEPLPCDPLPVAVTVCNSVGVIQGPLGAIELFKSMRRTVEDAGGIAVISGYRGEAITSHALGNYESTMNVCGQPRWLVPDTYAGPNYILVPHAYKRAWDANPEIVVDVYDKQGGLIESGFTLERDPEQVAKMAEECHIRTHSDYESYWYPSAQFREWTETLWPSDRSYYIEGRVLDSLRGGPAQLAVLDAGNHLPELMTRWMVDTAHSGSTK